MGKNSSQQSNEELKRLSRKIPKPRPLLPTLFRPVDTTTTCSENNTKKSRKPKLNSSDPCLRPTLKSPPGGLSTRPMPSNELKNLKKLRRSLLPNSRKWKNSSSPPRLNALLLRRPRSDSLVKSKIFKSISNEPTLPPLLLTRNSETSIKY